MARNKLIICKHCGAKIAAGAKACPYCGGKNRKPIFKRVWFWLLILLIVFFAAAGSGRGSSNKKPGKVGEVAQESAAQASSAAEAMQTQANTEDTQNAQASEAQPAESQAAETEAAQSAETAVPEPAEIYHVGDILQDGDVRIVYAASGGYEGNEYSQPPEGYEYIYLKLAFENMSETTDHSVSFYSFEAYADGYAAEMYYGGNEDLSATLSAGRKTMGYLYFTVPKDAQEIEIEYNSNFWTDEKITFSYDGEQDSGYELPKDTDPSPDAHAVGEVVELPKLKITYLACEEYISDNQFIQPAAGYHYERCTFEFENTGTSDAHISSFSFDAYADGVSCEQLFFLEDDLSSTLSAGRKVKGSVIFEVPDDAQTVEAEYLDNVWTSKRVVFTVK